jgi:hypothetical protein
VPIVPVLTPSKLVATLRALPARLDEVGVMLAEHACHSSTPQLDGSNSGDHQ